MGRGLGEIINALLGLLPPWAIALIAVGVVVVGAPGWMNSMRTRQIRSAIRRRVRAPLDEREPLAERAIERANGNAHLLALVCREARKRSMPDLYQRALDALKAADPKVARQVEGDVAAKTSEPMHVLEAVVRIRALLDGGAVEAAAVRLNEALEQHPDDEELLALSVDVATARAEAADPAEAEG
jgi:hypothetical protein